MMKLRLFILLLIPLFGTAQSTPEDLGKEVFVAFQSKDLEMLNAHFPKAQDILAKTRTEGVQFTPEQEIDFVNNFPLQINRYKMQCVAMFESEIGKMVDWPNCKFNDSERFTRDIEVPGAEGRVLKATDVLIHFSDINGSYTLTLSESVELNGDWFLGGGQVLISKRTD